MTSKNITWQDICSHSPYLTELNARFAADEAVADDNLRAVKAREWLSIAQDDLQGVIEVNEAVARISAFADDAMSRAIDMSIAKMVKDKVFDEKATAEKCGISVIALGKWGGGELNYSSDIDFMVVFDPDKMPVSDPAMAQRAAVRLTQTLVEILDKRTAEGYVFRCDLRLRPDPGATQVAVSLKACEVYYGSLGQNWERAAMIKARAVAGDMRVAADFEAMITSWVWRRNLDFSTIQDILSLKNQMAASKGRDFSGDIEGLYGWDVKRGTGGIREVELFTQIQQLIFGGKQPSLRNQTTEGALDALVAAGIVEPDLAKTLTAHYWFLRRVEHALQLVSDHQRHDLPSDADDFDAVAVLSGVSNVSDLVKRVYAARRDISAAFMGLYAETEGLASDQGALVFTGVDDHSETIKTLQGIGFKNAEHAAARLRGWHHGQYKATKTDRARQILTRITPLILSACAKTPDADRAFSGFDQFLEAQQSGVSLFTLLDHNRDLIDRLMTLFAVAPKMSELVKNHPYLIDSIVNNAFIEMDEAVKVLDERLKVAHDFEAALEVCAEWAHEMRFRLKWDILFCDQITQQHFNEFTRIADEVLKRIWAIVWEEHKAQHGTVDGFETLLLGFGRLGSRQMSAGSDLDIAVVYDAPDENAGVYAMKLVQRLRTALTAKTKHGALYEVDMRLRPHGKDGPLAAQIDDWCAYYSEDSALLERLSLLRARSIIGGEDLTGRITSHINILPFDMNSFDADLEDLREKTYQGHAVSSIWDVKYNRGGLMDMMLDAQAHQVRAGEAPAQGDIVDMHKGMTDGDAHVKKAQCLKRIQTILRLTGFDDAGAPKASDIVLRQFDAPIPKDTTEAEDRLRALYAL